MRRRVIILMVAVLGMTLITFAQNPQQDIQQPMSMQSFVEIIIPVLGIEGKLPPTLSSLSKEEAFLVECSVLNSNGLPFFGFVSADQCVTRGFLADVIFELVHRKLKIFAVDTRMKIKLMAQENIFPAGNEGDCLTREQVLSILNQPILTDSIAAFYSLPPFLGTQPTNIVTDPYSSYRIKNVTEETVSSILPSGRK